MTIAEAIAYYKSTLDGMTLHAYESFLELCIEPSGELVAFMTEDLAREIVRENTFEELMGFGSPLDQGLRNAAEDRFALAVLIASPNRHAILDNPTFQRNAVPLSENGALNFRAMAAAALHTDIMAALEIRIAQAVPSAPSAPLI